jgi:hypothetical protein
VIKAIILGLCELVLAGCNIFPHPKFSYRCILELKYSILIGEPEGKRPLGRPRCRWKDNIRMNLREI